MISAYGVNVCVCMREREDLSATSDVPQPHDLEVLGTMFPWRLQSLRDRKE